MDKKIICGFFGNAIANLDNDILTAQEARAILEIKVFLSEFKQVLKQALSNNQNFFCIEIKPHLKDFIFYLLKNKGYIVSDKSNNCYKIEF